jgi:hypothetical protein
VQVSLQVRIAGERGVREAIGGFPMLVRDGQTDITGNLSPYLRLRHPRTAVCYSSTSVFFAVVDGRQPGLSVGMTLEELAELMLSLGCEEAMNTDGGGSSVMAIALPAAQLSGTAFCTSRPPMHSRARWQAGLEIPLATVRVAGWPSWLALSPCNFHSKVLPRGAQTTQLQIVNSPSDGTERGRGNAWLVVAKPQE